jgi:Ser/Thr protein kinase RdoA (MazF antagonist)
MNVAFKRLSAADLNFNPARLALDRLVALALEHWGVGGEFTPLEGERDQNHLVAAADGRSYVLKVSAAGESEGAVDFQVAALRHLERHAPGLPAPRVIASQSGRDVEWIAAADGTRHMVRLLSWIAGVPVSQGPPPGVAALRNVAAFQARLADGLKGFFHPQASASPGTSCRACQDCARRSSTATGTRTTCCGRARIPTRSSARSISATWSTRRSCRTSP